MAAAALYRDGMAGRDCQDSLSKELIALTTPTRLRHEAGAAAPVRRDEGVGAPDLTAVRLAGIVAVLAAGAAMVGLLWSGGDAPATVVSVRGVTVELFGTGVYRYDSLIKGAGNRGSDLLVLVLGLPLLAYATARYRRGSARAGLLLTGVLFVFFYLYVTMSVSAAFNELFLVYCALVAASGAALVLVVRSFDTAVLTRQITPQLPARGTARFLVVAAGIVVLLWGGISAAPLLQGEAPGHLFNATTTVTPALDLGLLLPAFLMAALTLSRGRTGLGCLVAFPLLALIATLGPLIPVQTLFQLQAGASFTPGEVIGLMASWVVLGVVAATLAVLMLRSIDEPGRRPEPAGAVVLTV